MRLYGYFSFIPEQSGRADLRQVNLARIRCANPDSTSAWLPQFNGDFRVQGYISLVKSSWGSYHFFPETNQIIEKCFILQCWRILGKNSWIGIWMRMTSQIQSVSSCPHVNLWKNCHEDPFGSFNLKLLTDRQTYMYKRRALHNLVGGGNKYIRVWYRELAYGNVSSQTNREPAAVR